MTRERRKIPLVFTEKKDSELGGILADPGTAAETREQRGRKRLDLGRAVIRHNGFRGNR